MAYKEEFEVKMKPCRSDWTRCDLVAVVGSYAKIVLWTNRVQRYLNSIEVMCASVKCLSIRSVAKCLPPQLRSTCYILHWWHTFSLFRLILNTQNIATTMLQADFNSRSWPKMAGFHYNHRHWTGSTTESHMNRSSKLVGKSITNLQSIFYSTGRNLLLFA